MSAAPDIAPSIAIDARGLSRDFGGVRVVDGVDLRIPRATIHGFLGPNGAGKSTTIRMLCGLLIPSAGEVTVLGHPVASEAERVRRKLGYMTQRFSLWEDLSVHENLEFVAAIYNLPLGERRRRIDAALERYHLGDRGQQRAGTLSGGQKQRLALAAATLHHPQLLLLDEPTSAVDPQSRRDFWESLFDLVAQGTTILVSTHYMDEAERCHALAILDQGRLVAEGPPKRLMRDIDATVIEVETERPREARQVLERERAVRSVAQIGTRLHALLARDLPEPERAVAGWLAAAGLAGAVERVGATLEDVFVASTSDGARPAPGVAP
jgi:ABC-2 type transport system ATP-binding protein